MPKIDCLKIAKGTEMEKSLAGISENMPESKQRELGLKTALAYHKQIHNELQDFKKSLAPDPKKYRKEKYVAPDFTEQLKDIKKSAGIFIDSEGIKKNTKAEVGKLKAISFGDEGGTTFNLDGTIHSSGLVVPVDSIPSTVSTITPEQISAFVEKHRDKISGSNFKVGIYKFPNSNEVSIDLNIIVDPKYREVALAFGKFAGQESLYDLDSLKNIKTGDTGKNTKKFTTQEFIDIAKSLAKGELPAVATPIQKQGSVENGNAELTEIKNKYNEDNKISTPPVSDKKVDVDFFKKVADFHDSEPDDRGGKEVVKAYRAFMNETKAMFDTLVAAGYKIEPYLKDGEPYADSTAMRKDVTENKHLYYLRSKSATGQNEETLSANDYILFEDTGIKINGDTVVYNDLFRAVHDIFGHAMTGFSFSQQGEYGAYRAHSNMYTPQAQKALFLETLTYNAWYNFGKHLRDDQGNVMKDAKKMYAPRKLYNVPDEMVAEARKQEPSKENNSNSTQNFFSNLVKGASQPLKDWSPLIPFTKATKKAFEIWNKFRAGFSNHIETSIPAFRDVQLKKIVAISEAYKKGLVIDLMGSQGDFGKSITELNPDIKSINLDMNPDMQNAHNADPVKGADFALNAFGADVEREDGTIAKKFVPKEKADVVHESMGFQFVMSDRKDFIDEVADNYIKPDGVFIIEEKTIPETNTEWVAAEEKKDKEFKSQYYPQEAISKKAEEILLGMKGNMAKESQLQMDLSSRFKYVYQYWDSGNFKGYIASNSKEAAEKLLDNIGNTQSEFSTRDNLVKIENGAVQKQGSVEINTSNASSVVSQKRDSDLKRKIISDAKKVLVALKGIAPNIKVIIHDNDAAMVEAVGVKARGGFDPATNTIHVNLEAVDRAINRSRNNKSNTVLHEGVHPILNIISENNPEIINSLNSQILRISEKLDGVKSIIAYGDSQGKIYGEAVGKMETVVEFISQVANGDIDIKGVEDASVLARLSKVLKDFLKMLGINKGISIIKANDIIKLSRQISDAFDSAATIGVMKVSGSETPSSKINLQGEARTDFKRTENYKSIEQKPLSFFKDEVITITGADWLAAGDLMMPDGSSVNLKGGWAYPAETGNVWATAGKGSASGIINKMNESIRDTGVAHLGIRAMTEESAISNYSTFIVAANYIQSALVNKDITKKELVARVQAAYKNNKLSGKNSSISLATKSDKIVDALLYDFSVSASTFEERKAFLFSVLGGVGLKSKSVFGNLPTSGELLKKVTDPSLEGIRSQSLVAIIRVDSPLTSRQTTAEQDGRIYHDAYPVVIESASTPKVFLLDGAYNIEDAVPNFIDNSTKNEVSVSDYAGQPVFGAKSYTNKLAGGAAQVVRNVKASASAKPAIQFQYEPSEIDGVVQEFRDSGLTEDEIKDLLQLNGNTDAEIDAAMSNSAPQPQAPTAQPGINTKTGLSNADHAAITQILEVEFDAKQYPTIMKGNETITRLASETQQNGQKRELAFEDTQVIGAQLSDLKAASLGNAQILKDKLGKDWKNKITTFFEKEPAMGYAVQKIGLLNIISSEVNQDLKKASSTKRVDEFKQLQRRIDIVSMSVARQTSLALNSRRLYSEFAKDKPIADILSNFILTPEQTRTKTAIEEAIATQHTDEQLNTTPRKSKPRKTTQAASTTTKKETISKDVKDSIILQGAEAAEQTDNSSGDKVKMSLSDLLKAARESITNFKC